LNCRTAKRGPPSECRYSYSIVDRPKSPEILAEIELKSAGQSRLPEEGDQVHRTHRVRHFSAKLTEVSTKRLQVYTLKYGARRIFPLVQLLRPLSAYCGDMAYGIVHSGTGFLHFG
jgi:hypothetical protein